MIGHIAPEAALGGPIALVEEGDAIVIDVDRKALDLDVAGRRARAPRSQRWSPPAAELHAAASWPSTRPSSARPRTGAVTTGPRMTANLRQPLTAVTTRPDRDQDLAAGRRLADPRRGLGADRRARVVRVASGSNDHLTDIGGQRRRRRASEAVTAMAALAHRVPGKAGRARRPVDTFRHPAVSAKAATVLDHATGGRFILGLGAGWYEPEHARSASRSRPCRSASTARVGRPRRSRRCSRRGRARRPASPATTRSTRWPTATNDPAPTRSTAADLARRPEAARHRLAAAADGWLRPASLPDSPRRADYPTGAIPLGRWSRRPGSERLRARGAACRAPRPPAPAPGSHGDGPRRASRRATHVIVGIPATSRGRRCRRSEPPARSRTPSRAAGSIRDAGSATGRGDRRPDARAGCSAAS